jgi:hypothetical protein
MEVEVQDQGTDKRKGFLEAHLKGLHMLCPLCVSRLQFLLIRAAVILDECPLLSSHFDLIISLQTYFHIEFHSEVLGEDPFLTEPA